MLLSVSAIRIAAYKMEKVRVPEPRMEHFKQKTGMKMHR